MVRKTTIRNPSVCMGPHELFFLNFVAKKIVLEYFRYLQMIEYSIVKSGLSDLGFYFPIRKIHNFGKAI